MSLFMQAAFNIVLKGNRKENCRQRALVAIHSSKTAITFEDAVTQQPHCEIPSVETIDLDLKASCFMF